MSTFNAGKDRLPNGKPKPHRHPDEYWPEGHNPSWWDKLTYTRPRRAQERQLVYRLMAGDDADGLAWPIDRKPNIYYW